MHGHRAANHFVMSATGPIGPGLLYHYFLFKGHTGNIGGDAFNCLRRNTGLVGHHSRAVIPVQVSFGENLEDGSRVLTAGQRYLSFEARLHAFRMGRRGRIFLSVPTKGRSGIVPCKKAVL